MIDENRCNHKSESGMSFVDLECITQKIREDMRGKTEAEIIDVVSREFLIDDSIYILNEKSVVDYNGYRALKVLPYGVTPLNFGVTPLNYDGYILEPIKKEQVLKAFKYISLLKKKKKRCDVNSYSLKHQAEQYLRADEYKDKVGDAYISNGALIVAMLIRGFRYKTIFLGNSIYLKHISINVNFNVSKILAKSSIKSSVKTA